VRRSIIGKNPYMARINAPRNGFKGTSLIETKAYGATQAHMITMRATMIGFLRQQRMDKDFKLNIEVTMHTWGHTFNMSFSRSWCWIC